MEIINDIMELFNRLENTTMNPNNWEKFTIMHNALPEEIKNVVNFSADVSPNEFYYDIKNKVSIRTYNIYNNYFNSDDINSSNNNDKDDNMDHDLDLNLISHNSSNFSKFKSSKQRNNHYCHIYKKHGHATDNC